MRKALLIGFGLFWTLVLVAVVGTAFGLWNDSPRLTVGSVLLGVAAGFVPRTLLALALLYGAYRYVKGMFPAQSLSAADVKALELDRLPPPQLGEIAALRREEAAQRYGSRHE